ncbi:Disease resistance protein TIR-NBS-LRR class family [Abeliophyllum distichum]|uniref:Disease resistance protein TIR-NBS-LRR class family n=1 Tax=Abeliophyllum distichum TaxID=126358 RepID=A0ABD1QWB4_9LAMI
MIPFNLKKAGATYYRLVNHMFAGQIGNNMEVYVDDMLVKSMNTEDHIGHLRGMFEVLRKYCMKLNPLKCTFRVASGKFLSYMVNQRGIEANLEKIQALIEMRSPSSPKEVQSLMGRLAALNWFISKATNRCQPFFRTIKGGKRFEWTEKCEKAFQDLKILLEKGRTTFQIEEWRNVAHLPCRVRKGSKFSLNQGRRPSAASCLLCEQSLLGCENEVPRHGKTRPIFDHRLPKAPAVFPVT